MTAGHLLFDAAMTVYMALAALVEERDLVEHFGRSYRAYQQQVPMFVPRVGRFAPKPGQPAVCEIEVSPQRVARSDMHHAGNQN
jgi:hypothetical protein